jgi:hypothetical protein
MNWFFVTGPLAVIFGLLNLRSALGWVEPGGRFFIPRRAESPAWSQGVLGVAGVAIGAVMLITAFQ